MNTSSGGCELVSCAVTGSLLVVSALASSTDEDWNEALAPYQHLDPSLVGMSDEGDGTEIFIFKIATEVAA